MIMLKYNVVVLLWVCVERILGVAVVWESFQDHVYYVNRNQNFSECEARAACAAEDGYLVRVDSEEEWDFLLGLIKPIYYFFSNSVLPQIRLDITYPGDTNEWLTITGHPALPTNRTVWHAWAPDDLNKGHNRSCARLTFKSSSYLLDDDTCMEPRGFVCEKSVYVLDSQLLVSAIPAAAASLSVRHSQPAVVSALHCIEVCMASLVRHTAAYHPQHALCQCLEDGACDDSSEASVDGAVGEGWLFYKL